MARYPQAILVSCPVPWTSEDEVDEPLFRRLVRRCLEEGFRHVYVFGTGGEGYAVDTRRFEQVARVFREETGSEDVHAMVGVIGLSTAAVLERIELAHSMGFRTFQISLPSWGPLTDREVMTFFSDVCGACEDSRFLHYNLPRAGRVLTGSDYRRLVDAVPNLVATKTTGGGLSLAADLMRNAPELQHFMGEGNFPHGCMYGECSLLASYAELAPERTRQLFKAGREGRVEELFRLQHDFQAMSDGLWAQVAPGPHMDGAFDKMLVKLGLLEEFPLRLLSPYESLTDADYQACRRFLAAHHPGWLSGQQEVR
jgi:dihydrodipicolinate synthase/N-acetylneuraminate lyase